MRIALIIASALALAVALVIAIGGDEEDATVVETTTVTVPETTPEPEPETTPEEPAQPEPADPNAPADGHGGAEAPTADDCGRIAFEPNSDSGASEIEAAGTDCATARKVARGASNPSDDLSYEANGYRCSGAHNSELPLDAIEWFCVGPDREVVRFLTS